MKKIKNMSLGIIGILLIFSLSRISNAQDSYVGIQNGDGYEWELSVYSENWNTYLADDLESTLEYLIPLGSNNLTRVYSDWNPITTTPQSVWSYNVTNIGTEETGQLFYPIDTTNITSTPIEISTGYVVVEDPSNNAIWTEYLDIVNDTSSFLRQTMNLSLIFGVYSMMEVRFVPITIDWSLLVSEFLGVMSLKGGLYDNILATTQSNGFLINIPALGFDNNSVAIDINVTYNADGALSYYEFSYGGLKLVDFTLDGILQELEERERRVLLNQYIIVISVLGTILLAEIAVFIYSRKGRK